MSLFQLSLSGAVMIAAVAAVRAVAIHRLPKKTFLALWGITMLRLLIPFSIPSRFSVYSLITYMTRQNKSGAVTYAAQNTAAIRTAAAYGLHPLTETAGKETGQTLFPILGVIWIAGMFACLLFFSISYIRCRRRFAVSLPVRNKFTDDWLKSHRLKRRVEIRQSASVKAPLTYGLFHPVILMPTDTDWGNCDSNKYILAHELVHIKRLDVLTKGILITTLCIHWFNPLVWVMYVLYNRDLELSCDETVIRIFGTDFRSDYAHVLIHMEEIKNGFMPLCNNFSKNVMEERITAIMKTKKTTLFKIILAFGLVAGISVALLSNAKSDPKKYIQKSSQEALQSSAAENDTAGKLNIPYEISKNKDFPAYEEFGISYDSDSGCLMYDGKRIGFFTDEFSENHCTHYVDETGEIGIRVNRDKNWKITGMDSFPMSEIAYSETTEIPSVEAGDGDSGAVYSDAAYPENTIAFGTGDAPVIPDEEYVEHGMEWNKAEYCWYYNKKPVAVLYDHNGGIYQNDRKTENGITYIEITRDSNMRIEKVNEITYEQMKKLVHDNTTWDMENQTDFTSENIASY